MATITIIGGHGKIALITASLLSALGHEVRSTIRNPAHAADVVAAGATPVTLDIEASNALAFAGVIDGADAVIFSAGGGPDGRADRKRTVDLEGSLKAIEAAIEVETPRFLQVSAIHADLQVSPSADPVWRAYIEAKRDADAALRASTLDWTIVRPGRLTDEPGTGLIATADHFDGGEIPRADVAAVLVAALLEPASIGAQFEVISGDTPIETAVAGLD